MQVIPHITDEIKSRIYQAADPAIPSAKGVNFSRLGTQERLTEPNTPFVPPDPAVSSAKGVISARLGTQERLAESARPLSLPTRGGW